jgi:HK97 family phage portal protein
MGIRQWIVEKLNPAQSAIALESGGTDNGYVPVNVIKAYNEIPVVRRGVDYVIDACASFNYDVLEKINGVVSIKQGMRKQKLYNLLNFAPNPYMSADRFLRLLFTDFLLEGNMFIYYDGVHFYHLPAENVSIVSDTKTYIKEYTYSNGTVFSPDEIIHVADNSSTSVFRGASRLLSILPILEVRQKMLDFQKNFFSNNAVPGLVLKSPNVLGDKVKDRLIQRWMNEYNPTRGGKRPLVIDGGLEIDKLSDSSFKELDFEASIEQKDTQVLLALGVPPILLSGGNNANIQPNLRMFYLETILPIVSKLASAIELYFGYDVQPEPNKVSALQPDLRDQASFLSTLVNGGILTPNEARTALRYAPVADGNEIRVPANIAGSAADPSKGGRPSEED